jgi:transcriptional regulator with XRE-family HTH domain
MQLNEILAINLRKTRQQMKLTQEALAERAGLSARYIGAIERVSVSASINVLEQLADALEVEPGDLLRKPDKKKHSTK